MAVDWRSALGSHRPLLLNEVAVTPSSTPRIEWPCARLAALPGRWVQKCCRGSGYPVFWHRAIRRVAVALSTLHRSEQRSGDGKVGHCANLLIPHLRGNKLVAGFRITGTTTVAVLIVTCPFSNRSAEKKALLRPTRAY
jgi:hypothetical protein